MAQGKTDGSNWMVNKVSDTKENYFTVTYFTTLCDAASTCLPATKFAWRSGSTTTRRTFLVGVTCIMLLGCQTGYGTIRTHLPDE